MRRLWLKTVLAAVALTCSGSAVAGTEGERMLIKDFMFSPMALTTKAGTQVTFVNQDDEEHTVVSEAGLFRSGALAPGDSYPFKFDKPGIYHIFCSLHPQMAATVVVE